MVNERAEYMREYRARKKAQEAGSPTLPRVSGKPIVLSDSEFERMIAPVKTETGEKSAQTGRNARKTRRNAPKPAEEAEIPKNDLETTLKRQRGNGGRWTNPFTDGLDDTGYLIQRMSQHARDRILDRINVTRR